MVSVKSRTVKSGCDGKDVLNDLFSEYKLVGNTLGVSTGPDGLDPLAKKIARTIPNTTKTAAPPPIQ